MSFLRLWLVGCLIGCCLAVQAHEPSGTESGTAPGVSRLRSDWVTVSSSVDGAEQALRGWWSPAAVGEARPAVLMLHGCGGMLDRTGLSPSGRMKTYASLLNAQGWHTLAVDSLTPRGEKSICSQRTGTRKVTMTERRAGVWVALRWLAAQPDVDASRVAVLGWSNGGSAVLAASNLQRPDVRDLYAAADAPTVPSLFVAFYPGCVADGRRGYTPAAPVVLMLGLADDWTPAQPCLDLASQAKDVVVHSWEQAYHGFDSEAPVRLRTDVPNGVYPGVGVHVGGHPLARAESAWLLVQHLNRVFK